MKKYLVLENGMSFCGEGFGFDKEATAEIVFATSMTGYIETLTDPSYTGQAVVQTFPLIGNYGIIPADFESGKIGASAYIVREHCIHPSNFRSEMTLDAFLYENGIPGLSGIDTRALTRILREHGTMNGCITKNPKHVDLKKISSFKIEKPVKKVSSKEISFCGTGNGKYKIAVWDFGTKQNIIRSLLARDCDVIMFPHNTKAEKMLSFSPDGILLTNGPGDPVDNTDAIKTLKRILPLKVPIMGICLGHQLLALANGFSTGKLPYGHRGANQPVREEGGNTYITSQNHGYAVINDSINKEIASELFVNVNDSTNEGLSYKNAPAFSVQFHPEACGGPHDTDFLFSRFINIVEGCKNAVK
ncbi:MAG: carbamoyl phosphate synthase small subunit [Lachnospiraceae bacterium]|nr:carbamoyl phosphate synthase small subunit [Lachnospiraceae bacterium]